jgi:hypothetical protein
VDEVAVKRTADVLDERRVRHDRELRREAERRYRRRHDAARSPGFVCIGRPHHALTTRGLL